MKTTHTGRHKKKYIEIFVAVRGFIFISKIYLHSAYGLKDENGRATGKFSKKALKKQRKNSMSWEQTEGM